MMPRNLIMVRHGESEGNVANRLSRKGDNSRFECEAFCTRHSSHWRLAEKGREHAQWAGATIRSFGLQIGRKYTSPYIRAMETMGLMVLGGPPTLASYELRERSWGKLDRMTHEERMRQYGEDLRVREEDPFLWQPPDGEALVQRTSGLKDWLGTLYRECGDMECVVATCHAETIETLRVVIERMLPQHYIAMRNDQSQDIWNCSILQYTRQDPFDPEAELAPYFNWVRLITPPEAHEHGRTGFGWKEILRPTFSDAELLAFVEHHAPQIAY
jgi:broad specificity phosphatase PhoE